ncbi:MraY family glycosyltransferase [Clostridium cellulovorans]|uniref:Glycosyl transferase, family 4, conserved region n=1 Tax=Clostridium cellulovorans (strain ATCC 35296 / DSM 3052 / OCM 3 / 743B) TaxID=573061 RepID=D9STL6_CLOC7|nr:MraY family glycosyltransferase [Clostridium cellulovorans]ADL52750.1 Glycosyl transferase, family 4, conserved region [Clostridium cellulovorans 743B]
MISIKLFLLGFIICLLLVPLVKKIAFVIGAVDIASGGRRIHSKDTPLLGGLSIYIAFAVVSLFFTGEFDKLKFIIVISALPIVVGGILDDIYEIRPLYKIMFQLAGAVMLIVMGVKIQLLTNPFGTGDQFFSLQYLSIPITILWIIGVTNAFNLIDGLDGLCGGVAFISSLSIFFMSILNGRPMVAALTIILCGSILGFLMFNFHPATIFLGDTGSQLLGFLLAAISMVGTVKSATAFAVAVPILALGIPIYDTLFAMIRRKVNGKPILQADKGHFHHRLLDLGLSQVQAVVIIYIISGILGIVSIIALEVSSTNSYIILATVMAAIVLIGWKVGFFKSKE